MRTTCQEDSRLRQHRKGSRQASRPGLAAESAAPDAHRAWLSSSVSASRKRPCTSSLPPLLVTLKKAVTLPRHSGSAAHNSLALKMYDSNPTAQLSPKASQLVQQVFLQTQGPSSKDRSSQEPRAGYFCCAQATCSPAQPAGSQRMLFINKSSGGATAVVMGYTSLAQSTEPTDDIAKHGRHLTQSIAHCCRCSGRRRKAA